MKARKNCKAKIDDMNDNSIRENESKMQHTHWSKPLKPIVNQVTHYLIQNARIAIQSNCIRVVISIHICFENL